MCGHTLTNVPKSDYSYIVHKPREHSGTKENTLYITYVVYTTGSAKRKLFLDQPAVPYVGTFISTIVGKSYVTNQVQSIRFSPDCSRVVEVFILLSSSDEMKRFNEDKTWEDYPVADLPL